MQRDRHPLSYNLRTAGATLGISAVLVLGYAAFWVYDTWRHPPEHPIGRETSRADQLWSIAQFGAAALTIALAVIVVHLALTGSHPDLFEGLVIGALVGGVTGWAFCAATSDWSGEGQNGLFWLTAGAAAWGALNGIAVSGVAQFRESRPGRTAAVLR